MTQAAAAPGAESRWPAGRFVRAGFLALALGAGGFLTWALGMQINGAVIAAGAVEVDARRQLVQHPDGGLVAEIAVREGDRVAAGDTILVLDGAELDEERALTEAQLFELEARRARLEAETLGARDLAFPDALTERAGTVPAYARVLAEEAGLFAARLALHDRTLAQIAEREVQARAALAGQRRQLQAVAAQRDLAGEDLAAQQTLLAAGLTQSTRVTALRREMAQMEGRIGELEAAIAEGESTLAALEIEALRLDVERLTQAQEQKGTLLTEEAPLRTRLKVLDTRLGRLRLTAPMAGTVLDLKVHTVGGVVAPGAEITAIVPNTGAFHLAIRIDPAQIDRVSPGGAVRVRFSAFNANLTPEVEGTIQTIGADALTDPQTGLRYYPAQIAVAPEALAALGAVEILPGMPVEAYLQTSPRSPASWLLKPLLDHFHAAMREE